MFKLISAAVVALGLALSTVPAAQAHWGSSLSVCQAYTVCPNGFPIQCVVYAHAPTGTACYFNVIFGRAVSCTGFDAWGRWQTYTFTCGW